MIFPLKQKLQKVTKVKNISSAHTPLKTSENTAEVFWTNRVPPGIARESFA